MICTSATIFLFSGFFFFSKLKNQVGVTDMEEVVSVLPNSMLKLHTTRSWDFMGFNQSHVRDSQGGDVIVGLLDTGQSVK